MSDLKIVHISSAPTVCNKDGAIRHDVTSLDAILNHIDTAEGRNDALRAYIYSLRDLQRVHDSYSYADGLEAVDQAEAAVAQSFDALIAAEFRLNRRHRWVIEGGKGDET
jgi:hypothetical protein